MDIRDVTHLVVATALLLGLFTQPQRGWAQEPPESGTEAQEAEPSTEQEQEETEPRVDEYVFVEGSLPFVPDSNTVVTKLPLELRFTPNNVGMVTGPVLREQFDRVASDALVNVSNVNIQTQNGIHDFFVVRGFDSLSSSLVLTDGAPEPEATFYQMYNVERVELLKGPGGFLYGSNPLAGTLNLVRKQPLPASFLDFRATAGSYENFEGGLDWNYAPGDGTTAFRLNALARDQGSYRDGKGGSTFAINPSFTWQPDADTRLNLNFEYMDLSLVPDSGLPIAGNEVFGQEVVDVDRETNYQSPLDASDQKIFRLQADFERKLAPNVTLRNKFYHRGLDWQSAGTLLNGVIPTGPASAAVLRTFLDLDDQQNITGNQLETVVTFDTGSVRHSLLGGFELARQADQFLLEVGLLPLVDAFDPVEPPGSTPIPTGISFEGDARSIIAAPYVIDQIEAGPVHVLLGGRLDTIDFEDPLRDRRERRDTEFSPMAGVLVSATEELSIYGNYSRAFSPPSPRVFDVFAPEKSEQVEGGVKLDFAPMDTQATVAVYQLERDNIPIADDNGFTQQIGNQRSRGFEIDLAAQPAPDTRAFLSYAFNDSVLTNFSEAVIVSIDPPMSVTVDRSGNQAAFAPRHILNFWLSHDLRRGWSVGGGGRYVGSQFVSEANSFSIDGVMTFDATVAYRLRSALLRLNLRNLTNREYFQRGFGATSVIPAPPFTAYFSVDVQL